LPGRVRSRLAGEDGQRSGRSEPAVVAHLGPYHRCGTLRLVSRPTLYGLLAEPASTDSAPGETITTKAKETVDNDAEAFGLHEFGLAWGRERPTRSAGMRLYDALAVIAPEGAHIGETLNTRRKETVDNDVEAFCLEGVVVAGV
jgi:hypothetical protein